MTVKELLTFFESYYGEKYTGMLLDVMTDYLADSTKEFLLAVGKVMVLRFSRIYNKVPCPADIEKHINEIYEAMSAPKHYLPEPAESGATSEEALEWLKEIKDILSKRTGPTAKPLNKLFDGIEAANA